MYLSFEDKKMNGKVSEMSNYLHLIATLIVKIKKTKKKKRKGPSPCLMMSAEQRQNLWNRSCVV